MSLPPCPGALLGVCCVALYIHDEAQPGAALGRTSTFCTCYRPSRAQHICVNSSCFCLHSRATVGLLKDPRVLAYLQHTALRPLELNNQRRCDRRKVLLRMLRCAARLMVLRVRWMRMLVS